MLPLCSKVLQEDLYNRVVYPRLCTHLSYLRACSWARPGVPTRKYAPYSGAKLLAAIGQTNVLSAQYDVPESGSKVEPDLGAMSGAT